MHQPIPRQDHGGIGRGFTIVIILGVMLAGVVVHSIGGGPSRFLESPPGISAAALVSGQTP